MSNDTTITSDNRFAIIPHWVIFSPISDSALRLYAVLMKYANNETGQAWPSRKTLAKDMNKGEKAVDRAVKELKNIGALKVAHRLDQETGEHKSNIYTVITAKPQGVVSSVTPPTVKNDAQTIPTELNPYSLFTSNLRSDDSLHAHAPRRAATRTTLVHQLTTIGEHLQAGYGFWDHPVQDHWETFLTTFETWVGQPQFDDLYGHLLHNTWTISSTCANPYQAGAELNKIIATAHKQH
ncbi:helix-turn-helix domain-containing protein [Timonella sp. A28]|uniref:helix-turn-helix domain-containing protein n=1 Tax=Timonella sp. A28 TaxID=3442640 RepID=UPI003EBD4F31